MKKVSGVIIALLALACVGSANATMFGFDIGAGFYQPRDGRFTGVGIDVSVNAKISNDLLIGYRVEELQVKGTDAPTLAAGGAGQTVHIASLVTFQGVQGWFTVARAMEDKLGADIGLWFGAATTNNFPSTLNAGGGANGTPRAGLNSPFVEPQVRLNYLSKGSAVDAKFSVGAGYRFVRNFNVLIPFYDGGGANTAVAAGGDSRALKDFDGLDFTVGFGLMF